MEQLDILIIGGAILSCISLALIVLLVVRLALLKKQLRELKAVKLSRSKRKRRKQKRERDLIEQEGTATSKMLVVVLILGLLSGSSAGYAYYYQQTNLSPVDQANLTESTLYVQEIDTILANIADDKDEKKKQANIREIASHMSSLSLEKADFRAPSDVQLILNRYYKEVGQLGVNLANETTEHLKNDPEIVAAYVRDIERIAKIEEQIYAFYGITKTKK